MAATRRIARLYLPLFADSIRITRGQLAFVLCKHFELHELTEEISANTGYALVSGSKGRYNLRESGLSPDGKCIVAWHYNVIWVSKNLTEFVLQERVGSDMITIDRVGIIPSSKHLPTRQEILKLLNEI